MAKGSHYDKPTADYAVSFIEALCHTKGTWAGKPFELMDWQEQRSNRTGIGSSTPHTLKFPRKTGNPNLPQR